MKLEIDCTWNNKQEKGKLLIHFDHQPKKLFGMPSEEVSNLQQLNRNAHLEGPPILKSIQEIKARYPKSLYAHFAYCKTLEFFEYDEERAEIQEELQKKFPDEVLTKCLVASSFLKERKYDLFSSVFNTIEVLKGAFPKRRLFYYEEALFFHTLWAHYFGETHNPMQHQKHRQFIYLILSTAQTFLALAPNTNPTLESV